MTTSAPTPPGAQRWLENEPVIWMTTVRSDGQPQSSAVWFVYDEGAGFLIYSRRDAPRIANIRRRPRVSLSAERKAGGEFVSVEGIAVVTEGPPSTAHVGYQTKYAKRIDTIGYTPQTFEAEYSLPIRVAPTRWRVFGVS